MNSIFSYTIFLLFCFFTQVDFLFAQPTPKKHKKCKTCAEQSTKKPGQFKKGEFFSYWGYNRAFYSKSDIHFIGNGSDFTLNNVVAKDRPTKFNFYDYFVGISIPQFVFNAGYFFKDNWAITFGTDHMKYVLTQNQESTISGTIASTNSTGNYAGNYLNTPITIRESFLKYEHTDGLNYINTGIEHYKTLWKSKQKPHKFTIIPGASVAIIYPRTQVQLFNSFQSNNFHVAGWGSALHLGFRFNFLKNGFILLNNKGGFINLPSVLRKSNDYKANQYFFFLQSAISIGYNWRF